MGARWRGGGGRSSGLGVGRAAEMVSQWRGSGGGCTFTIKLSYLSMQEKENLQARSPYIIRDKASTINH